jgi:hypothetical protein
MGLNAGRYPAQIPLRRARENFVVPRIGQKTYKRSLECCRTDAAARSFSRGVSMAFTAALRELGIARADDAPSSRDDVLARYRRFREISKRHHDGVLALVSSDALLKQARRLGLARGKTLMLEDMEEMNYVYDLTIHTAAPLRTRAIDRYAASARFAAGSDEALVLEAMCASRFSILLTERRHETAGLMATDLFRRTEVRLVDIGLESCMSGGELFATRLFTPECFSMTAGVYVPFDFDMLPDILDALPRRRGDSPLAALADNRHFAEAIYRIALADGIMDRVTYQDLPDEA